MNKEIIEAARHCINGLDCILCPMNEEPRSCSEVFIKAIVDHYDKYDWHDLRKDPTDLPEDNDGTHRIDYEIVDESGNHDMCEYFGTAGGQYPEGSWELNAYCDGQVIAWREIEPFN